MSAINTDKIMFLDIETVPSKENLDEIPQELQFLWEEKYENLKKRAPDRYDSNVTLSESFEKEAGIFAEFGKIVCISVGFLYRKKDNVYLRLKSYYGENEYELLNSFAAMLNTLSSDINLCGHNIKEFDIPFIARRMLIQGIKLPEIVNVCNKKPWELKFLDTMDLWRFGDYKHYTSLKLLTAVFNIPSPKEDIDGSKVGEVFYKEKNLERIKKYCERDVSATVQVFLRLNQLELIKEENIEYV